jgi:hypothetical protein
MKISALEIGKNKMVQAMFADKNDGAPWSPQDLDDLRACIESGLTVAQTATALSREGSIEDILRTAEAHGWKFTALDGVVSVGTRAE